MPASDRTALGELLDRRGAEFGVFPMSSAQRRMWLLHQVRPGNAAYNLPFAFRVGGELAPSALEQAVNDLVRRHEALRTIFPVVADEPRQVVLDELEVQLVMERPEPGTGAAEWVARRCDAEARRPFDVAAGPLLRVSLFAPGASAATLMITVHHIVCDGWSLSVIFDELSRLYEARLQGRVARLTEPELQFGDFTLWQRERLSGETKSALLAHWRERLEGAPTLLELPADRSRPSLRSLNGELEEFSWPAELEQKVSLFASQHGVTSYATLLAAFASVVHRYTGRPDMLIATAMANRVRPETERIVGCFINTVPLRLRPSPETRFNDLVRAAHETVSTAHDNQELPLEDLVADLRLDRDLSYDPLVQVLFVLQDGDVALRLPGAVLRHHPVHGGGSIVDFGVALRRVSQQDGGGISGVVEYNSDLFEPATVRRFTGHLSTLLEAALETPDAEIGDLPLLTGQELRLLRSRCSGGTSLAGEGDVPALFEEQAGRSPGSPALVAADDVWAYGQLDEQANRLAHHLIAAGVGRGDLVGVALSKSFDLLAVFLGVLKAGAVYVPLDPGYPQERLRYMIADCGLAVLVTRSGLDGPGLDGVTIVRLDEEADIISSRPAGRPSRELRPDDVAYVIYTSGSTGEPKGTAVTHRGLRNCAIAQREVFQPRPTDTVLQFASPSFDASVFEFVWALCNGARLCVVPREQLTPGPDLVAAIRRNQVTMTVLPPTVLGVLSPRRLEGVRTLLVAGEACPPETVAAWAPGRAFCNAYGPTEAAIWSTVAQCTGSEHKPPIGHAIPGTAAYVLDERLHPVPIGVPGELCVGGAGVASGYLGRPALTARQFPPDPFSPQPGKRLYRTGDLVRWLPNGELDYLGRIDRQVKIRGHRIELPEIEIRLEQLDEVGRGVVTARPDASGRLRLVAYVQPAPGRETTALDVTELRGRLRATLPEFMVPGVIVVLSALPLNSNGKIDHGRLPEPPRTAARTAHVAPVSAVERHIAAAWQELLGLDEVGVHDNFFDLGGDSLLLARVREKLAAALRREVPTLLLFEHPTVRDLARALIGDPGGERGDAPAPPSANRGALIARARRTAIHPPTDHPGT
jgi:amino acid adenylation domain-containing protein